MKDQNIYHQQQVIKSMSLKNSLKSENQNLVHGLMEMIENKNSCYSTFIKYYFAGVQPSETIIDKFIEELMKDPKIGQIFTDEICQKFPGKFQYEKKLLKMILNKLESKNFYETDEIYFRLCFLKEIPNFYRIFIDFSNLNNTILIEEKSEQLSNGTTGLSSWQAAFVLAEFLKNKSEILNGKNVLELGAGCGLTGIACFKFCNPRTMVLTDFHEKVLEQMEKNVDLNGLDDVKIQKLDWMNFEMEQLEILPDVVIAADVVYDPSVLPGLATTLKKILSSSESIEFTPVAYLACTIRNPTTLNEIKNLIHKNDLKIVDIFHWKNHFTGFLSEKYPQKSFEYENFFPIPENSLSCFDVEILQIQQIG